MARAAVAPRHGGEVSEEELSIDISDISALHSSPRVNVKFDMHFVALRNPDEHRQLILYDRVGPTEMALEEPLEL